MQALITGVGGFAGRHLATFLSQNTDWTLYGSVFEPVGTHQDLQDSTGVWLRRVDLREELRVQELIRDSRPDYIFHLAALASVGRSWHYPWETISNNVRAQLNIFQALVTLDLRPRVLIIGSADQYGLVHAEDNPITENTPFRPNNPYSVSKIAQDMLGLQYFLSHQVPVIRARPFNHIGPGQARQFVAPDFASQIAQVEAGAMEPVMSVGNLEARRDFTDVRDVVRAYYLAVTKGTPGEAYNIGAGAAHSIRELLDTLLSLSTARIEVQQDPKRMRPSDVPLSVCDATRLRDDTGWAPEIPFERTLADVLDEWRRRVAAGELD
ncbi:MAG: GDP-mannose 4,6-dehydratase [Anaerolineae bacterium]|nr:GDP-mannose 4,6-dehydratase [Anaerolineae bacterium]